MAVKGYSKPNFYSGAYLAGRGDTSPAFKKKSVFEQTIYPQNASWRSSLTYNALSQALYPLPYILDAPNLDIPRNFVYNHKNFFAFMISIYI